MKKSFLLLVVLFISSCFISDAKSNEKVSVNEEVESVQSTLQSNYLGSLGSYTVNLKTVPTVVVSISKPPGTVIGVTGPYANPDWEVVGSYVNVTYVTGQLVSADNGRVEVAVQGGYYTATLEYTN